MSIYTVQSKDPATCTIRTVPDHNRFDYVETIYGPMELARLIGELGEQLSRMLQLEHEARRARR